VRREGADGVSGTKPIAIISYFYLPVNTSAVQRIRLMARYLPDSGYAPRIVTSSASGRVEGDRSGCWVPSAESPASAHRASAWIRRLERFLPYNDRLPWGPYAVSAVRRIHAECPFQAILSSSPPIGSHMPALRLKKELGLPWIADLQDPLRGNPTRDRWWGTPYDALLERAIFDHADILLAVTDVVAEDWKRRFPRHAGKIRVVWCGFDPEEPVPPPALRAEGPRILLHAGYLYRQRYPWTLLESLDRLSRSGRLAPSEAVLHLVGAADSFEKLSRHGVVRRLRESGMLRMDGQIVPRAEAIRLTSEADYLLLIDIVNLDQIGYTVPAKIFDYLRAGRPILALTDRRSPVDRILERSGVPAVILYHGESPETVDGKVLELFRLPSTPVTPREWFLENFDGQRQMRTLAGLLDGIIG
jgi:glycosyltransferase involved in cell wall biosynthesis